MALDGITNFIEDTPNDGDAERQFVTPRRLGDSPGRRAGDKFRRGRMRSMLRAGTTKPTRYSESDVSSAWKLNNIIFLEYGQLNHRNVIPAIRTGPKSGAATAMDNTTGGENLNVNRSQAKEHPCDSPTRSCDRGGVGEDREETPEVLNQELLAYIREIRAKSTKLLNDVRQLRLRSELRVYPF